MTLQGNCITCSLPCYLKVTKKMIIFPWSHNPGQVWFTSHVPMYWVILFLSLPLPFLTFRTWLSFRYDFLFCAYQKSILFFHQDQNWSNCRSFFIIFFLLWFCSFRFILFRTFHTKKIWCKDYLKNLCFNIPNIKVFDFSSLPFSYEFF